MKNKGFNLKGYQPPAGRFIFLFFSVLLLGVSPGGTASQQGKIAAFSELAPGLYRGGQPTEEGYRQLKSLGVKTILNFRNEKDEVEWEKKEAEQWGMNYISLPWTIYGDSNHKVAEKFLEITGDPTQRPLFMHCRRGVERTGVMSALYYIHYGGLSEEEAYRKAFRGFPMRWFWKPFVKQKFDFFKSGIRRK